MNRVTYSSLHFQPGQGKDPWKGLYFAPGKAQLIKAHIN